MAAETPAVTPDTSEPATTPGPPERDAWTVPTGFLDASLWERLARGFDIEVAENARIQRQLRALRKNPRYFNTITRNSRPYLHWIVEAVEARKMPMEVALIPAVESAYDPFALSRDRASGPWQFLPATGRQYGLRQNWWYDGRRDIVASTRAALDHLAYLNKRFEGDWLLTLAAYNAGEGTLSRAMRNNRRKKKPVDFWHLKLPGETRIYVARLLAMRIAIQQPDRVGVTLPDLPDRAQLQLVKTGGQIDLAIAAEMAGVPLRTLQQLNPGLNRWATPPDGPHYLLLPRDKAAKMQTALRDLPASQRIRWRRHQVAAGETLSGIAHRYQTSVDALRDVNKLRGNLIRVNQGLLIPVASRAPTAYPLSTEARLARSPGKRHRIHEVRRGDTLWDLARHYDTSVKNLARWNGLDRRALLRPGQKLAVGLADTGPDAGNAVVRTIDYTVRKGDSLYSISDRFDVSIEDLRKWNGNARGRYLHPGQRLKVRVRIADPAGITDV